MATPGDKIAIQSVNAFDLAGRFNTVKFTFTGDTALSEVRMFDADDLPISILYDVESEVEYSIMTGEAVGPWEFFPLPPAPISKIEFYPDGEDVVRTPPAKITNIQVGTRTTLHQANVGVGGDSIFVVFQEVKDRRYFTNIPSYQLITGGSPSEWPRDPSTGMYYTIGEGSPPNTYDYIGKGEKDLVIIPAVKCSGDYLPIIGLNSRSGKIDLGMLNTEIFKKYYSSVS